MVHEWIGSRRYEISLIPCILLLSCLRGAQADPPLSLAQIGVDDSITENTTALVFPPQPPGLLGVEVYGMRVELPANNPFGYDERGVCSIDPDERVKVVLYGINMDRVEEISFTKDGKCQNGVRKVNHQFTRQLPHRIGFPLELPSNQLHEAYQLCIKPYTVAIDAVSPYTDVSLWLTTYRVLETSMPLPLQIGIIALFLTLSALFSGLTLGLMSLTPQELELVMKSGSRAEQKYAAKILPIRKKGNLLLCALLLGNVIVNASISILFGELTSGLVALIISSLGIVIFGEIIPQSICVKKGLAVGAHTILITQFFIFVTFPLAWPISKLLDCLLGEEYEGYDRKRLMELMKMSMKDNDLSELKIAVGAMEIADKVVQQVMTKIDDVFMLPDTTILNARTIAEIVRMGYTRIPVYSGERTNVTDILFVKDLALLDPDDNFSIRTVCGYHQHPVKFVYNDTPLALMLEIFKKGEAHLALVKKVVEGSDEKDPNHALVGLVTLEDIVEEILQAEIMDETDEVTDNKTRAKRNAKSDLSKFFEKEAPHAAVSSHLLMVTMQFLVSNEEAFTEKYISKSILERLISTSAKRVDMSLLKSAGGDHKVVPKIAKLYTKDEMSDRYILILEGRAKVTIGQKGMMFEAGPFHRFGQEIMEKLVAAAQTLTRSVSIIDPTLDGACRRPDLMFTPDFSVTVTEDCTYLEVTIAQFINAYRSSMMMRDKENLAMPASGCTSHTSSLSNITAAIDDPESLLPGADANHVNERQQSISDAKEALLALNAKDKRDRTRNAKDDEEVELLQHSTIDEEHPV